MKTAAVLFGLIISLATVSLGQAPTVTNATLERFQQKRLAAEKEYRDNHKRLGMPSPEELDRQREADMAARLELAEQLRQARLEKERLELERRALEVEAAQFNAALESGESGASYGGYFGGYGGFDPRFYRGRKFHGRRVFGTYPRNRLLPLVDRRGAYRVTPFGVIAVPNPRPARVIFRNGGGIRGKRR